MLHTVALNITNGRLVGSLAGLLCALFGTFTIAAQETPGANPIEVSRSAFMKAWEAARTGDRETFEAERGALQDYLLDPYLEYNVLLSSRSTVDPARMADFLQQHEDWAFTAALKRAWLRSMGKRKRWDVMLQYAEGSRDTEIRCYLGRAKRSRGQTEGLLLEAQTLWLAGQSQPKACDALFDWLIDSDGVSSDLAWGRIKLAFDERNPQLVPYLTRFLSQDVQIWGERWRQQDKERYRRLDRAIQWSDADQGRDITRYGLRRLARSDGDRAWSHFKALDGHFNWSAAERASILREIALWSSVEGNSGTVERMRAVQPEYRDDTLLEWWARAGLTQHDWAVVVEAIDQMTDAVREDDRWRYWHARALIESGELFDEPLPDEESADGSDTDPDTDPDAVGVEPEGESAEAPPQEEPAT